MVRAYVDRDITPTERLTSQLPDEWDVTVGIETDRAAETLEDAEIVFVTSRVPMTREVIERAEDLRVIGKIGTGIDSVDLESARRESVVVTYTPGHNALSVAEHTLCLTLAAARRLTEARTLVESGRWRDEYALGTRLSGSTVGIVGFGDVGKRFGTLLTGFDVDVLVYDPYVPDLDAELVGGRAAPLEELLRESDVVCLCPELTEETRHLIDDRELSLMDSSAILVNTSRGPVVRKSALLSALREGEIGGAGLDVFDTEPLDRESELLEFDNVVLTPHVSAMTAECRAETIDRIADNVTRVVRGEPISDRYLAIPLEE